MAFKMKGPSGFKQTHRMPDGTMMAGAEHPTPMYQKKTLNDYLDEGFSQVEAEQMLKEGATTGRSEEKPPNDDKAYYNKLIKLEKDGSISKSQKSALDRLRAEEG
tara:strand:+ start:834 stop:1148 length:315 start_codon:yes stop_codon:yes gene_type:complete